MMSKAICLYTLCLVVAAGCAAPEGGATLVLASSAFADGERIPVRHTCDGENVSPELSWSGPPAGTQSFVLIVDDPDARGWVHWVLFDLPGDSRGLPEGVPPDSDRPAGGLHGETNAGLGYHGPCPPEHGGDHRYVFSLYALDVRLSMPAGSTRDELMRAAEGHVLSRGDLVGTYGRP